jgi:hypothetical protein
MIRAPSTDFSRMPSETDQQHEASIGKRVAAASSAAPMLLAVAGLMLSILTVVIVLVERI